MTIQKSSPDELIADFQQRYQNAINENQQLTQKIKENEAMALKLLGAIEALQYLQKEDDEGESETVEE